MSTEIGVRLQLTQRLARDKVNDLFQQGVQRRTRRRDKLESSLGGGPRNWGGVVMIVEVRPTQQYLFGRVLGRPYRCGGIGYFHVQFQACHTSTIHPALLAKAARSCGGGVGIGMILWVG